MSTSETLTITYATRHCTEYRCRKCASRARWFRRRGWRSRKNPIRRSTGKK